MGAAEGADNHWGTQKSKLGLAFPNLPWYIDANVKMIFDPDFDNLVGKHPEAMEPKLKQLSEYLSGGKKFLLGDSISIADFTMYISLDWHSKLDEGFLAKFPILD